MSILGIALENFSALPKANINSTTASRQRHEVFHPLLSDGSKQDAATTTAHRNRLLSSDKSERNTACCGHGSMDEFISICDNALKCSN